MRNLSKNIDKTSFPLLCLFNFNNREKKPMSHLKVKRVIILAMLFFALSSVLAAGNSFALFEGLRDSGREIFEGMREIIYAVAGFGIFAVAIGAFFGNINWRWLTAIIVGLIVIATTGGILKYVIGDDSDNVVNIRDTLISGGSADDKLKQ